MAQRTFHPVIKGIKCKCDDCKLHNRTYQKDYRSKNPEIIKNVQLKFMKGITLDEYNTLFASQKGVCASCGEPETTPTNEHGTTNLAVDHNRKCCPSNRSCGKCIRGLLCHHCNVAEGLLKTPERTRRLAEYMERHR